VLLQLGVPVPSLVKTDGRRRGDGSTTPLRVQVAEGSESVRVYVIRLGAG